MTGTWVGVQAWATPGCAEPAISRPRGVLGVTLAWCSALRLFDWSLSAEPAPTKSYWPLTDACWATYLRTSFSPLQRTRVTS